MLALTRKKGESIVINNNIEISVLEIRGDRDQDRYLCTKGCADLSQGSIFAHPGRDQGSHECGRSGSTGKPVLKRMDRKRFVGEDPQISFAYGG